MRFFTTRRLLQLGLLLAIGHSYAQSPSTSQYSTAKLLIVASYHPTDYWTRGQLEGVLDQLSATYDAFADISIEYLYTRVPRDPAYMEARAERIAKEYSNAPIELIITLDNAAFHLLRDHGSTLFPDTPIVFGGLNHYDPKWLENRPNVTGIIEESFSMSETLELALEIFPNSQHIFFITGEQKKPEQLLEGRRIQIPLTQYDPSKIFSWEGLVQTLNQSPTPAIICLDTFNEDHEGNPIDHRTVLETLSQSKHPIFVSGERYLGYGAIGGRINNPKEHGRSTAEVALQVLDGTPPQEIPIRNFKSTETRFDYTQLKRFKIPVSRLPGDAIILNLPQEPYKKFLSYFFAALIFIIVQMILITLLVFNIRKRKSIQAALETAKTKAEAANAAKSEFLAIISHEFRTPLNAILGFTQILDIEDDPKERKRYLHLMRSNGDHLLYLIDNLLNYIFYGQGNVTLKPKPYQLENELRDLKQSLQAKAESKGLVLSLATDSLPPLAMVDWPKLREVFTNLLDNAIKCTDSGSITLEVRTDPSPDGSLTLRGSVTDTGCGIPSEELEHLFLPFTQADTSNTRKVDGVGLGLAICRRLVKALGGGITCESQPDRGTRFTVTLPIAVPAESTSSPTIQVK